MRVLVVEDESEIRELLVDQFRDSGMECLGLDGGALVLKSLESFSPDVILLDQMMPGRSGAEIIGDIRADLRFCEIPIIMLTGLDGETEKVKALNGGADDYVTKPFSVLEVQARIHALVRRSKLSYKTHQNNMRVKDLVVDLNAHQVLHKGQVVPLTLTEFKILVELLRQSGQVLTRDRLREKALGNLNVTDRTIDVHMTALRKKLEDMGEQIETVRGVGYRLSLK